MDARRMRLIKRMVNMLDVGSPPWAHYFGLLTEEQWFTN